PGGELHQAFLVGRISIDLVGTKENEWSKGTVATRHLQERQGPDRIDIEVVERTIFRKIVRGLGGTVNDQVRVTALYQAEDRLPATNIQIIRSEMRCCFPKPFEIPCRIPVGTEKVPSHIIVDPVNLPAALVEKRHSFGANQPAAARHQGTLHDVPLSFNAMGSVANPRTRSSSSACANRSALAAPRHQRTSSTSPCSHVTFGSKPKSRRAQPMSAVQWRISPRRNRLVITGLM